jgi:serine/threonine protein kinase
MAPEQWTFTAVDGRTDLYALGVLIYRMISGKIPFTAPTLDVMMQKHLKEPLPNDGFSNDPRAGDLYAVVKVLTAKKPAARYQSADVLIGDLDRMQKGQRTRAAEKFGLPGVCTVCETVAPPDTERCLGCNSSLKMQHVEVEDLLGPEPEPQKKNPYVGRQDLRRKRLPPK